ncbi:MAG: glycoside hydrolase family 27 protein [Bryobacteraceae bacterium]
MKSPTARSCCFLVLLLILVALPLAALDNGLAKTPPMGWNSWNKFGCNVSETLIRGTADAMVASGMKDAGYQFVVIDDCWQVKRDGNGAIVADPERFPSGIKALADYVHSKGLKFGIYSDAGMKTCAGRPGSHGYEFQDARTYAAWGVDYLKYDWCNAERQDAIESYTLMSKALRATGRPIVFSLCEWGSNKPWLWAGDVGNLWRATGDIVNCWDCKEKWGGNGVVHILDLVNGIESYAGPGHWNDPDMLEVGNGKMTSDETRAHFAMWAILAAPLIAGNDLRSMDADTRAILTDKEILAIDQDPLGRQGRRVAKDGEREVWARELQGGYRAVALLNRAATPQLITVKWEDLGYPADVKARLRSLWEHKDLGSMTGSYTATVAPHAALILTVKP